MVKMQKNDVTKMYRFRSIDALLDKHHELENQEIYFAKPSELNDPMEGLSHIFFGGDRTQWCIFFKLFINEVIKQYSIIHYSNIPIPENIHQNFIDYFMSQTAVLSFLEDAEDMPHATEGNMKTLLNILTPWIVISFANKIHSCFQNINKKLEEAQSKVEKILHEFFNSHPIKHVLRPQDAPNSENVIFATYTTYFNIQTVVIDASLNIIMVNPEEILESIKSYYVPKFRIASFNNKCDVLSVWGHYTGGQKGACLCFNTIPVSGDYPNKRIINFIKPDWLNTTLYKVHYNSSYWSVKQNGHYFKVGCNLSIDIFGLISMYLCKNQANMQKAIDDVSKTCFNGYRIKMADWKYEKEYRIIIPDDGYHTKLRYDFSALHSIIFGMNTSFDKQKEIIDIIRHKCEINRRKEFNFYQVNVGRNIDENEWKNTPIYTIKL